MPPPDPASDLESLLAEALARFDEGGHRALAAFVAAQSAHATALERGIRRCREMGMLGPRPGDPTSFPERLGEYRLLRRIGGGGMGVVYLAEQIPLARKVALKLVRPELLYFPGARERFRREVEAVAKLRHPNVVPIHTCSIAEDGGGVPYYAMEWVDGASLDEVLHRGRFGVSWRAGGERL